MPQIAIIQAAPQSTPAAAAVSPKSPGQFTPHLEKAVAKAKTTQTPAKTAAETPQTPAKTAAKTPQTPANTAAEAAQNAAKAVNAKATPATDESVADSAPLATSKQPADLPVVSQAVQNAATKELIISKKELPLLLEFLEQNGFPMEALEEEFSLLPVDKQLSIEAAMKEFSLSGGEDFSFLAGENSGQGADVQPLFFSPGPSAEIQISSAPELLSAGKEAAMKEFSLSAGEDFSFSAGKNSGREADVQPLFFSPGPTAEIQISSALELLSADNSDAAAFKFDLAAAASQDKNSTTIPLLQNQPLLVQLQHILTASNETGTRSIHGLLNTYLQQIQGKSEAQSDNKVSGQIPGQEIITEKSGSEIPLIRQELLARYFEARIITRVPAESMQGTENKGLHIGTSNLQSISTQQSTDAGQLSAMPAAAGITVDQAADKFVITEKELPLLFKLLDKQEVPLQTFVKDIFLQTSNEQLSAKTDLTSFTQPATGKNLPAFAGEKNFGIPFVQTYVSSLSSEHSTALTTSQLPVNTSYASLKIDVTTTYSETKSSTISSTLQNQTVLHQLQQIINSGKETTTVSVQGRVSASSLQEQSEAAAQPGIIVSANQVFEQAKVAETPDFKPSSLRQDMQGQYFEARINTKQQGESGSNTQSSDQQNSQNNQQSSSAVPSNASLSAEQQNSFQHISSQMRDMQVSQSQNSAKPIVLPSGTVVSEDNVIQQVVERFQINARGLDTKLSMKLYPAELGELKIDITMKEGSIKAHVVAQSQQILEIIEKNMVKLRNSLENGGITVEEIVVTSDADSVPDFDVFEQHLSQQQELSQPVSSSQNNTDFEAALVDAVDQSAGGTSTGVNIQA